MVQENLRTPSFVFLRMLVFLRYNTIKSLEYFYMDQRRRLADALTILNSSFAYFLQVFDMHEILIRGPFFCFLSFL